MPSRRCSGSLGRDRPTAPRTRASLHEHRLVVEVASHAGTGRRRETGNRGCEAHRCRGLHSDAGTWAVDGVSVQTGRQTAQRQLSCGAASVTRMTDSGRICVSARWHGARHSTTRGAAFHHVRAGRSDVHRPVRDCPGPFRDLPRPRGLAARRRGPPAFCGAGVSRFLAVRLPGRWLCSVPAHSLRIGSTGRVLLQGSGLLSQVRWSPHGRTLRAFGRSCLPRRAGPPVGAQSAASVAVPAGVGSRSLSGGQRRGRADGARIPPAPANGMPPLRVSSIHLHGGVDAVDRGQADEDVDDPRDRCVLAAEDHLNPFRPNAPPCL